MVSSLNCEQEAKLEGHAEGMCGLGHRQSSQRTAPESGKEAARPLRQSPTHRRSRGKWQGESDPGRSLPPPDLVRFSLYPKDGRGVRTGAGIRRLKALALCHYGRCLGLRRKLSGLSSRAAVRHGGKMPGRNSTGVCANAPPRAGLGQSLPFAESWLLQV